MGSPPTYLYLHGFASGPGSQKAQFLRSRFLALGLTLHIPDLNQGGFSELTLTRQINQTLALLTHSEQVVLIGSSLGGFTAALLAEQPALAQKLQKLVLLAPAFDFLAHWLPRLGSDSLAHWQQADYLNVYHYGEQRFLPLKYAFVTDAQQYAAQPSNPAIPTLILHGRHDDTIPLQASRQYASNRPWVRLHELNSDHSLTDVQAEIWQVMQAFLALAEPA
ncbi:YqiA/YcfP family alpha/beta fold hydrolase [Almyronema epifaneia]|uniref:YqiA/YcfP family alpha/beta fold hydrolase n=1 Tax=Almyronema epifaneia S1 TaxID=2991925 RepID=A0ABW6IHU3_9CYAN